MLTALILICSTAVASDIGDCTAENARTVMRVPAEFGNPITCYMQAQAYVAETSFGRELGGKDRLKIVCVRRKNAVAVH